MPFNPETDIPNLSGKVIVVTGGSSGLGKESVHQLAKHNPSKIFLTARTEKRANAAIQEIELAVPAIKGKIIFLELDLASFASINKAAETFKAQADRLDLLMNNAGLIGQPAALTEDGYEVQFGSNYMGPALFTKLLLDILQSTAEQPQSDVRVVNLSSELFKQAPTGMPLADNKTVLSKIGTVGRYANSKLAQGLHTKSMARKHPKIKFVALHPGAVNTGIIDDFKRRRPYLGAVAGFLAGVLLTDVHKGARAQLWACTAPSENVRSGGFYSPALKEYKHRLLDDEKLEKELEDWTEAEFKSKGF
jgi:NAD(P)-dependent dehydrogenase (short-subunit alcohol dehydrogenase family)